MIGFLQGSVKSHVKNPIILVVHGVGYAVHVPDRVRTKLVADKEVSLSIHTHVSDDAITLYGFATEEELTLFELLLTVSGIGPRTSLAIIDRGVSPIQEAIASSDVDFFTTIPRLGKKNAQKIIIELKSKLGSIKDLDLGSQTSGETKELLDALTHMGFAKQEVFEAIKHLDPTDKTLKDKIRHALKILGK